MPVVDIFHCDTHIDRKEFQGTFYILKCSQDPDDHSLRWKRYGDPPVEADAGIVVWMQGRDQETRIAFVFPDWKLTIAGIELPRVLYSNMYVDTTFELAYHDYRFAIQHRPIDLFAEEVLSDYSVSVAYTPNGSEQQQIVNFSVPAWNVGDAIQETIAAGEQRHIQSTSIIEVKAAHASLMSFRNSITIPRRTEPYE
jgi:hypothetical protein